MAVKPLDIVIRAMGVNETKQAIASVGEASQKTAAELKRAAQAAVKAEQEVQKALKGRWDAILVAQTALQNASKAEKQAYRESLLEARLAYNQAKDAAKDAAAVRIKAAQQAAAAEKRELTQVAQGADHAGSALKRLGAIVGAGFAADKIRDFSGGLVEAGSDAVESENLIKESFKGSTDEIQAWGDKLQATLGISSLEARKNAGVFNVMFGSMGIGSDKALDMSKSLTMLANDMASFYNLKPEEAFEKLRAGITGEAEPLKALGILIDESTVKQYAYQTGIAKSGEQLTEQQKVLARHAAIMAQTSQAQGDMARTLDAPANVARRLDANLQTLNQTMGEGGAAVRAWWQGELIPLVATLNESGSGALKLAGGVVEVGSMAASVVSPIFGMAQGLLAIRDSMALSTIAKGINTTATNANTVAMSAAAVAGGTEAAAVATAGASSAAAGGLAATGAIGFGALAATIGLATVAIAGFIAAYLGYKDAQTMSDESLRKKWGPLADAWIGLSGSDQANSETGDDMTGYLPGQKPKTAEEKQEEMQAKVDDMMTKATSAMPSGGAPTLISVVPSEASPAITPVATQTATQTAATPIPHASALATLVGISATSDTSSKSLSASPSADSYTGEIRSLEDQIANAKGKENQARREQLQTQLRNVRRAQQDARKAEAQANQAERREDKQESYQVDVDKNRARLAFNARLDDLQSQLDKAKEEGASARVRALTLALERAKAEQEFAEAQQQATKEAITDIAKANATLAIAKDNRADAFRRAEMEADKVAASVDKGQGQERTAPSQQVQNYAAFRRAALMGRGLVGGGFSGMALNPAGVASSGSFESGPNGGFGKVKSKVSQNNEGYRVEFEPIDIPRTGLSNLRGRLR